MERMSLYLFIYLLNGVLFMDLPKAFDTINHDHMSAKLKAYEFSTDALNLMHSYLKNRKHI